MSSNSMADIAGLLGATNTVPKNSTSRKGNTELNMEDFLQLMVVQLQSQTIDDTMDTSEMMNQMIQMQMITALTNMTETNIMTYASSLVGKVVTIGLVTGDGLEEREIIVTGTGVSNGQQVIFGSDGETYALNQIMAVGRLPEEKKPEESDKPEEGGNSGTGAVTPGTGTPSTPGTPTTPTTPTTPGDETPEVPGDETGKLPDDRPVDNVGEGEDVPGGGEDGGDTVNPAAEVQ